MSKTAIIHARIEPEVKKEAENILSELGINHTQAITIFYKKMILKKGLPFALSLEQSDSPENYTKIKSKKHLKSLLNI